MEQNKRTIYCTDAIEWLKSSQLEDCSVVASLPDISEFPNLSLNQWKEWFVETAELILSKCPDEGVTIFYQTDIKVDGAWVDKGYLCQKAAENQGHAQLFHKIICRNPAGTTTFGRPSYTHILCFSSKVRANYAKSTPDVLPEMGEKTWERGMGFEACQMIARFIKNQTNCHTVVHPFCGEGSMLAVANAEGLKAIGIERSPKRAESARQLKISENGKSWI